MKKFLCMLSAVAMIAACSSDFDDAPLWESVNDLEERVGKLEELCRQMNTNLSAMKTIVDAVGSSDYVTGVTPVTKDGKVVGYTIAFYRHEPVTIYHGTDGKDGVNGQDGKDGVNGTDGKDGQDGKDGVNGTDGKDGHSPVVSVRRDTDGNWYWTLDGEWLRDDSGNRIRANGQDGADGKDGADGTNGKDGQDGASGSDGKDGADGQNGITPQLKIENEYWYISYDNGRTWTMLGKATSGGDSGSGDGLFSGVDTSNADYVVFMLGDGTRIQLPTWSAFEALRTLCNQMNTNIESLRKLVEAVQNNDYITSVVPLTENGRAVGYTISFAHSPAIVIYHGKDGADGKDGVNGSDGKDGVNGQDGHSPVVSVRRDTDGNWYWTLDGAWLRDAEGNRVRANGQDGKDGQDGTDGKDGVNGSDGKDGQNGADGKDGITPRLKIENGRWMLSLDEGRTWTDIGQATGADGQNGKDGADGKDGQDGKDGVNGQDGKDGDSMFASVTVGQNEVTFVLSDGTSFSIPKDRPFGIEFADTEAVRFAPGSTYRVAYTLTGADAATEIEVLAQDGLRASVERTDEATGFVVVTTPLSIVERSTVIVLVSDGRGKTLMKSLNFVYDGAVDPNNGVLIVTTAEPFVVGAAGGSVVVPLQTNLNYRVEIAPEAAAWLRLAPATRAALREETLTFTADANTSAMRRAFVYLIDLATETIAQTLCITQSGDEKALAETIRFVDPNFETFLLANYDLDGDGKISKGEALEVVTLDVSDKSFTDLTGLEWFTNLISLNVSNNRELKTFDVTKLTALETLICNDCALTSLDLSQNKALKYLNCAAYVFGTKLTRLDLSQNKALINLNCSYQAVTILDLSQNTELKELYCYGRGSGYQFLQTLKIPNCSKLHTLDCNTQKLSTIDLSGCPELSILNIYSNNLMALDLSRNPKLAELRCSSNAISSLNLSANPQLKTFDFGYNPLTELNLGTNISSVTLNVKYTSISSLKVTAPNLKSISITDYYSSYENGRYLLNVDLFGCSDLESLLLNDCSIMQEFDFSKYPKLKTLYIKSGAFKAIDLRNNPELESLTCYYCSSLKDLDIMANLKLKNLNLQYSTAFQSLDLSAHKSLNTLNIKNMKGLQYLNLGDNPYLISISPQDMSQIKIAGSRITKIAASDKTYLDVTECPALQELSLQPNMEKLDLSKNPLLKTLTCKGGLLTSLDLSANTALETVDCSNNKLRSLDVTRCEKLKTLNCYSNFLETLDVSGNLGLTSLDCSPMESLKTLFMDSSQRIRYITYERNTSYIPEQTEIVYR